ncbi:MAG: hypothetical protein KDA86_04150 [Planctomycetaceae bacterium]|nr:hypothetical protein [Planctomycetaceae bacterium]
MSLRSNRPDAVLMTKLIETNQRSERGSPLMLQKGNTQHQTAKLAAILTDSFI